MSESNYWSIKVEVTSKDGQALPGDIKQKTLENALKRYDKESGIDEYPDDLKSVLCNSEIDGDRFDHYTRLMSNLEIFKDWLDGSEKYNITITKINDYLAERDE